VKAYQLMSGQDKVRSGKVRSGHEKVRSAQDWSGKFM